MFLVPLAGGVLISMFFPLERLWTMCREVVPVCACFLVLSLELVRRSFKLGLRRNAEMS